MPKITKEFFRYRGRDYLLDDTGFYSLELERPASGLGKNWLKKAGKKLVQHVDRISEAVRDAITKVDPVAKKLAEKTDVWRFKHGYITQNELKNLITKGEADIAAIELEEAILSGKMVVLTFDDRRMLALPPAGRPAGWLDPRVISPGATVIDSASLPNAPAVHAAAARAHAELKQRYLAKQQQAQVQQQVQQQIAVQLTQAASIGSATQVQDLQALSAYADWKTENEPIEGAMPVLSEPSKLSALVPIGTAVALLISLGGAA